uniref:Zinc finger, C2H2 type family protein n=1 Tax=Brugia malayi TaxID=6279 RepID=A8Q9Q7_BRUMA
MFFTVSITPIIWFNLLLCIASNKNETSHLPNFGAADKIVTNNTYSDISDSFDYNNFEPLFGSEFPSDPSQLIDFDQLSEIEDISSKESIPEITNAPHPGFSNSHDTQSGTSSPLNVDTDDIITYMHLPGSQQNAVPIYFHQLILSPDDTSDQHGNAEQNNMGNKHFSDHLIVPDYRENTNERSETDNKKYICHYPGCTVITKNYKEYITHKKSHGQPFIYECKVPSCGRTFDHESSFCCHIHTHQPKHQCKNCGKLFSRKSILQRHNKHCGTPPREQSYECLYPGCTMVTKNYSEYVAHRKTHGQPFIYECRVPGCERIFQHESSFCNHKQTHEPHHQCKCCGKFFSTMYGLQRHKKLCPTKFR